MNSMTGYGYKEVLDGSTQVSVEIKAVNSRFLDLGVNLPPYLNPLELRIRKYIGDKVVRGKIDLTIRIRDSETNTVVIADTQAAKKYHDEISKVAVALGKSPDDIPLSLIISQEGVLSVSHQYDPEYYWNKILPVLDTTFEQFQTARAREGANLKTDLLSKLDVLDACAVFFKEWQPKMEEKFKETISCKFNELLGNKVDENKILEEVAVMLVRYTINEEIVRLFSHLEALRKEITDNPVPGKRIDFFCQEANREINTIGSKNQFPEVGKMVVTAKDALENIREQAKNVE